VLIQAAPQIFGEVMGELSALIAPPADDPAAVVVERESLRLALIASLQHLPARRRVILILREVLAFSAAEPAELLEPTDQRARALFDGYIAAFERSDAGLLEQVLRTDATLEATPFRDWQAGRAMCIHMLGRARAGHTGRLADDRDYRQRPTRRRRVPPGRGRRAPSRRRRGAGPHRHRRLPRDQVP
jgi:hypothetical protein